jgi:hypothetical protein
MRRKKLPTRDVIEFNVTTGMSMEELHDGANPSEIGPIDNLELYRLKSYTGGRARIFRNTPMPQPVTRNTVENLRVEMVTPLFAPEAGGMTFGAEELARAIQALKDTEGFSEALAELSLFPGWRLSALPPLATGTNALKAVSQFTIDVDHVRWVWVCFVSAAHTISQLSL